MKLGCNTILFNQLDLYGALQHIAWAGYDGAELSDLRPGNSTDLINLISVQHMELNTDQSYIDEVKWIAKKHGLELFSINTEEEGETDEDKIKSMTKVFDMALKLSIPIVVPYLHGKSGNKEVIKRNLKYIRRLTEQAGSRGITLAISIHTCTPIDNTSTAIQMLDDIDSSALGVTLDTREICRAGDDPSEAVTKIGKRIVYFHCRDYPRLEQIPRTASLVYSSLSGQYEPWLPPVNQQIPGRGGVDFPKILKLLKNTGYNKVVDVVMAGALTYSLSKQMGIAAESRGYLNRCLQELKQDGN